MKVHTTLEWDIIFLMHVVLFLKFFMRQGAGIMIALIKFVIIPPANEVQGGI